MTCVTQYRAPITALLLMAAGPVLSANCGEPSPRLLELGDAYYAPIHTAHASSNDSSAHPPGSTLDLLLQTHFRSGSGTRTTCLGTGDRIRIVVDDVVLDDIRRNTLLNGEQTLTALEEVSSTEADRDHRIDNAGTVRSRQLSLPPASTWSTSTSGLGITTVSARRRSNALGLSLLQEQVWHATPSSAGLVLKVEEYVNGVHSGSVLWRLKAS